MIGAILSAEPDFAQQTLDSQLPITTTRATTTTRPVSSPDARLSFRVYNYARIDRASLASSEKVATAILQNVGVTIAWVDCPSSQAELPDTLLAR